MSQVLTTPMFEAAVRGYFGYELAILQGYRDFRVLQGAGPGDILQRFLDAISQGDQAYQLEEFQIWQDWINGVYGNDPRSDRQWERGWSLHKFPPGYLKEHPSPIILVSQDVENGRVPTLPQEPQKRVTLRCDGVKRVVRIRD